jgi:hypothetical protein
VTDTGAAGPAARRIITPVRCAWVGFVHDKLTEVGAATAATPVTGPTRANVVVEVTDTPPEYMGVPSWANRAYEYWVPSARPVSVNEVAGLDTSETRVPSVTDTGAAGPAARRIITPVRCAWVGFVHDNTTVVLVGDPATPATGPGAVAAVVVVEVSSAAAEYKGVPSWANNAYEYCVPGASPVSVNVVASLTTSETRAGADVRVLCGVKDLAALGKVPFEGLVHEFAVAGSQVEGDDGYG